MKKRLLIFLCCGAILLSGCGARQGMGRNTAGTDREEPAVEAMEQPAEIPVSVPNICVDRVGYESGREKIAVFRGDALPDTFTLRDAETDRIVYTGTVKNKGNDDNDGEYNGYGDFSDYREPGRYYVQMEVYGESYPFLIQEDLYPSLFREVYRQFCALDGNGQGWQTVGTDEDGQSWQAAGADGDGIVEACQALYQLLLSYELFPEIYTDDTGIPESGNGVPDILDLCGHEARRLTELVQQGDNSGAACGYLAASLAKYAYLSRGTDTDLAGQCLSGAESAWKGAEKDLFVSDDLIAMAAAELYRLTGSRQYLGLAEEYLGAAAEKDGRLSDEEFLAAVTYMNTRNPVDVELCDHMMKKIMAETEEAAGRARQDSFLVDSESSSEDIGGLLGQAGRFCVINHIITNHEYGSVIEDHLHYLMGRNPEGICYVSCPEQGGAEMEETAGDTDVLRLSALMLLLSERLGNGS